MTRRTSGSSKMTTRSTQASAATSSARSASGTMGLCGPLQPRAERSLLTATSNTSAMARAPSRYRTWPTCSRSNTPLASATVQPCARRASISCLACSSEQILWMVPITPAAPAPGHHQRAAAQQAERFAAGAEEIVLVPDRDARDQLKLRLVGLADEETAERLELISGVHADRYAILRCGAKHVADLRTEHTRAVIGDQHRVRFANRRLDGPGERLPHARRSLRERAPVQTQILLPGGVDPSRVDARLGLGRDAGHAAQLDTGTLAKPAQSRAHCVATDRPHRADAASETPHVRRRIGPAPELHLVALVADDQPRRIEPNQVRLTVDVAANPPVPHPQ